MNLERHSRGMMEETLVYGDKTAHVRMFHIDGKWFATMIWTGVFTPDEEARILRVVPGIVHDGSSFVVTLPVRDHAETQRMVETFTHALGISTKPQEVSYRAVEKRVMATPDWGRLIDAEMRKPKLLTMGGRRTKRSVSKTTKRHRSVSKTTKRRRSRTPRRKSTSKH